MLQKNLTAFNKAITTSMKSECAIQHGSVVMNGGKIVGQGYNSKEDVKFKCGGTCRHAEAASLLNYLHFYPTERNKHFKVSNSIFHSNEEQQGKGLGGLRGSNTNSRK